MMVNLLPGVFRSGAVFILIAFSCFVPVRHAVAQENAAIQWNNAALQEIRYFHPGPTINSRVLAITHTCMFDAWAAYDSKAVPVAHDAPARRPAAERTELNKRKAVSYAAYRCLSDLFPADIAKFHVLMAAQSFDAGDDSKDPATASGVGNLAAQAVLNERHHDGANQLGDLNPGPYTDYTKYVPVNEPDKLVNPDRWQPLRTPVPDHVMYGRFIVQKYQTPQWLLVKPFAMTSGAQFRPARGPATVENDKEHFVHQAEELLQLSAALTDEHKMIAEYWADGPNSETPPGHWCLFAQFVSQRDHHSLDDDVKLLFILSNAMLDAGIAAWDAKRVWDSVRPVTAIRFLFAGKQVHAWGGRFKGPATFDGAEWQPYQAVTMAATPPFPEFVSGHSTFSAAGAEVLKLFTGSGVPGFAGDGGPATQAQLAQPDGITIDATGALLIADLFNNRIRRIPGSTRPATPGTYRGPSAPVAALFGVPKLVPYGKPV